MKRFMFASIGLLCLMLAVAVGYHLGSQSARAEASPIPGIAFVDGSAVLDVNGETWDSIGGSPYCWFSVPELAPLPIPMEDIANWSVRAIVTVQGDMWIFGSQGWENCGPWPGGPVETKRDSWGAIKGQYEKKD